MAKKKLIGVLEALFVTFLWSSSYIFVKIGLNEIQIPPLALVTLRYLVASAILMPLAILKGRLKMVKDSKTLVSVVFLGFAGYTVAQGLQCLGLYYLPAVSVTFLLNFTPVMVLFLGLFTLEERPNRVQLGGTSLVILGAYLYFNEPLSGSNLYGIIITLVSSLGWASYIIYSRRTFVKGNVDLLGFTAYSMTFGALLLTTATFAFEGVSFIPLRGLAIIVWLGTVNTALAFFLWNNALRHLGAFETSILQNTMLIQIAILSFFFLGEQLSIVKLISMALVLIGVITVQIR